MAVLYVTEFVEIMQGFAGRISQAVMQPPVAEQTIAIGATTATSASFNVKTRLIRVHSDAICSIEVGLTPAATATTARFAANQTEYFGVPVGQGFKIAVITNT